MIDICPACGLREADDAETGWCKRCAGTAAAESYEDRKLTARRDRWQEWTARRKESA